MPWQHCSAPEIHDTEPCPECGISKDQWTLEFNVTRQFTIRRRAALRLALLDPDGAGVAGEPYRIALTGGEVIEGELDDLGQASHTPDGPGDCTITFPGRPSGTVVPYVDPEDEEPAAPADDEVEGGDAGGPASFVRAAGRRHRFQLRGALVLRLTLVDEQGHAPLRFVAYTLAAPDGARLEGVTDGRGRLDHGFVTAARYELTVRAEVPAPAAEGAEGPGTETLEVTVPATAVVPLDAFMQVRVAGLPRVEADPHEDLDEAPGNPRWSSTRCRFDEVVELLYDLPDAEDGAPVELEIFEHDADGAHDAVACVVTEVRDGRARVRWHMPRVDDGDDTPTQLDEDAGFALPEFFFVARHGDVEARCEELLTFATDLELPLEDARGNRLANTDYALHCHGQVRRGTTDAQGLVRESGVGPDFLITVGDDDQERVLAIVEGAGGAA